MPDQEHPNAALMRSFYDAFGAADRDMLSRMTAPDMVWHLPGDSPIGGDWLGVAGLLDGVRKTAMTLGDGRNGFELLHVFGADGVAMSVHRDFYNGPDDNFDLRYTLFARIEDGRLAEVWEVPFNGRENDRFWNERAAALNWTAPDQSALKQG